MNGPRPADELRPALARLEEILRKCESLAADNDELRLVGDMLQPTVVALSRAIGGSESLPDLRAAARAVGPTARVFTSQNLLTLAREASHVERVLLEVADRVQPIQSAPTQPTAAETHEPPPSAAGDAPDDSSEDRERVQAQVRHFAWAHMLGATILCVLVLHVFLPIGLLVGGIAALTIGILLGQLVTVLHGEALLRRLSEEKSTRRSGTLILLLVVLPFSIVCVTAAGWLVVRLTSADSDPAEPVPQPTPVVQESLPTASPAPDAERTPVDRSQLSRELNLLIDAISDARRALDLGDLASARRHIDIAARYDRDHPLVLEAALRLLETTKENAIRTVNEGHRKQAIADLETARELAVRFGFSVEEIDRLVSRIQRQTLHREIAPTDTEGLTSLIGRHVTVVSRGAISRNGRLTGVTGEHIAIETADVIGGGTIDYILEIPRDEVVTVRYQVD